MRRIFQALSWLALAGTLLPAVLFYLGKLDLDQVKLSMLVATVVWFLATSLWMGREPKDKEAVPAPPGQGLP